jgi:stage V sporulation protein B
LTLLYFRQLDDAAAAAPSLFILAIGIVFLSSTETLAGVLQGVGKQMIPVINIFIGACIKVVITYVLTGIPVFNIKGAAIGTVTAYGIAAVLNYISVVKYTGTKFDWKLTFLRPLISAAAMGIVAYVVFRVAMPVLGNTLSTGISIIAAVLVYAIMLFATRSVRGEELRLFPKGEALFQAYSRLRNKVRRKAR